MGVDGKELRAIIDHHENLEADKKQAQEDQAQLLEDAKERGFDKAAIKRLIKRLRRDAEEIRQEQEADEAYLAAYMNFDSTPLGAAAAKYIDPKVAADGARLVDEIADHFAEKAKPGAVVDGLGTAQELTEEQREAGVVASFSDGKGGTSTISFPGREKAKSNASVAAE